jgi:undecaprenyl-diphosphatase
MKCCTALIRTVPDNQQLAESIERALMNSFDYKILLVLNQIADWSPTLTKVIAHVCSNQLKTALIGALLWYAWFDNAGSSRQAEVRERLAACFVASCACVGLVRVLAEVLPFRVRPLANTALGLHFSTPVEGYVNWNSFPSDNAVMFSLMATSLFLISRPLGVIAALDVALLVCFPRVFVGIHHPTDVIAGALIGVSVGYLIDRREIRRLVAMPVIAILRRHAPAFYAGAFLTTFLLAQVFGPVLSLGKDLAKFARILTDPAVSTVADRVPDDGSRANGAMSKF